MRKFVLWALFCIAATACAILLLRLRPAPEPALAWPSLSPAARAGIERESFYRLLRKHGVRADEFRG